MAIFVFLLYGGQLQAAETIPADTATPLNLPSGQGIKPNPSGVPEQFYSTGQTQNSTRSFSGSPSWTQKMADPSLDFYPPFGANLFQGNFAGTYYEGVNPDYVITPGDRIQVRIWGAQNYTDTLMVDQQGNIFLPEAGPFTVAGLQNRDLASRARQFLSSTYKSNVEIYINLLTAQPVAVYVSGFVTHPGRYAGGMNDSVLYFLDKAGGIIPDRGSYRDIIVSRGDKVIARVDLYNFILQGSLGLDKLHNGDVIVVGPRGGSVIAGGLIPQFARYEYKKQSFNGAELTAIASPLPAVSHVGVSGTRNAEPFRIYLTLKDFASFHLTNEDMVEFLADTPGEDIMVAVTGAIYGPTRHTLKRGATLRSLLAYIPVDAKLSNLDGIYLKRRSVAEQQRKAIMDSLRRLQNSLLTASSATQEAAAIRVQEAQLVQNFVQQVADVKPDGVVVITRSGEVADIVLEDGDEIVIPQLSDIVQINGEVIAPKAVTHIKDADVERYIREAGGFTDRADKERILIMKPNGEIAQNQAIYAGDMLLVMPQYDSKTFPVFKDIMQIIYQVAISAGVFLAL
jgi:protein involved in polysaccharide export with SLBB domain